METWTKPPVFWWFNFDPYPDPKIRNSETPLKAVPLSKKPLFRSKNPLWLTLFAESSDESALQTIMRSFPQGNPKHSQYPAIPRQELRKTGGEGVFPFQEGATFHDSEALWSNCNSCNGPKTSKNPRTQRPKAPRPQAQNPRPSHFPAWPLEE